MKTTDFGSLHLEKLLLKNSIKEGTVKEGWYYGKDGRSVGPFTLDDLRKRFEMGELDGSTQLWNGEMNEWKKASNIAEFNNHIKEGIVPPPPSTASAPVGSSVKKSAGLAAFLSFLIIGLGQMYLGQVVKGIVMLVGAIFLGVITAGISIIPVLILAIIDAYQVGKKVEEGKQIGEWEWF